MTFIQWEFLMYFNELARVIVNLLPKTYCCFVSIYFFLNNVRASQAGQLPPNDNAVHRQANLPNCRISSHFDAARSLNLNPHRTMITSQDLVADEGGF